MNLNRVIKLLALAALLALMPRSSHATGEATYSKGHSTWTAVGFNCSSGTAVSIIISTVGFITSGVRITNESSTSTYSVWLGPNQYVSTKTLTGDAAANRGEKLAPGASGVWELGYDSRAQVRPKIFCLAADQSGTNNVPLSIAIFGY